MISKYLTFARTVLPLHDLYMSYTEVMIENVNKFHVTAEQWAQKVFKDQGKILFVVIDIFMMWLESLRIAFTTACKKSDDIQYW